jgi:hypothetical protein
MTNAVLFYYLINKHKKDLFKIKNLSVGIFGSMAITVASIIVLETILRVTVFDMSLSDSLASFKLRDLFLSSFISLTVCTIFYIVYYYRFKQESKVKEQKIIAGAASAQFNALKNQLDPHFLFNSLNVLTSLIEENPEAATRFTTALSKVYRYVLEQKNKELVTVEEELKFAKLYMSLIKMRFEDSIVFNLPERVQNPQALVVPLSLQLLLENAVKHNQVTPNKKLFITIKEQDGNLIIENNLQPKNVVSKSTGVGLQNIRQRYRLLTKRPVSIGKEGQFFRVGIPMLTEAFTPVKETQKGYIEAKKYDRALKRVKDLKGFYIHFTIYLLMLPVFIYLNLISTSFPWALFPIGGWGLGVSGHAFEVFNYNPLFGKNWEQRKIRELMEKDKRP